ncbi:MULTISPECIES: GNAT family N-acetyltransferase [Ensifer]|uniref:GNAT family N-acetyltransferase n=1 Tax=Ensifer canadensis TaxID=555315 RepID=A0AAW4FPP3_9HYPH|nr:MULTISPECIES: GNAT family N-acetyltransferase [Ensifer]MDP9630526.1 phosphinothricin acetyltransferase [Ensifer adhaerens]KQU85924.1 acetyltransferase [Ensifer sp. Root31]KQW58996.1 acetyltransferase [Ensifer sp. Root1252]KQW74702.1 acetyltransferase [Ensifer sp. Root127]KQY61889.1 acetyltransferase [Ensifer sp. Root142]
MLTRQATKDDLPVICDIYNDAVANTTAIWNDTIVDVANRAAWLRARSDAGYPVLVAVADSGDIVGYASFGDWRAFDGYRHTVEHSVYVHRKSRGGGIGRELMVALIAEAERLNKHVMVAGIESENAASIRLHQRLGFTETGRMREVGTKFGRWLDLTFMQLVLSTGSPA